MKKRQQQRLNCYSKAENWAKDRLDKTNIKWSRERIWRWRIYDFWNDFLGCAVEIDGKEHDNEKDKQRDLLDFNRSGIIVIRVRNFNEQDMDLAIEKIANLNSWIDRRAKMGLLTKAQKLKIQKQDEDFYK